MGKKRIIKEFEIPSLAPNESKLSPAGSLGIIKEKEEAPIGSKSAAKESADKPASSASSSNKSASNPSKTKVSSGTLYILSTYNNTLMTLTDKSGNALFASSSGALGFKGAKKGTPFASAKISDLLANKALDAGIKEVDVVIKGVGAGRESGIRTFASRGIEISAIRDVTPMPHNGPKPKKPRRV